MARAIPDVAHEFGGAELGDARLARRLMRIAECMAVAPAAGFPKAAGSDGELEGVYRFLGNERVTPSGILTPHFEKTIERIGRTSPLVVHDTTVLSFGGTSRREGLGRIRKSHEKQGFFAHVALAVAADGSREPLGIVGLHTYVRGPKKSTAKRRRTKTTHEWARWADLALKVEERLAHPIHVMDREADSYETLDTLAQAGARFVIRLWHNRLLTGDQDEKLFVAADRGEVLVRRTVPLSRRRRATCAAERKNHPPRTERIAHLRIRAASVEIARTPYKPRLATHSASLRVNVVSVQEVDLPEGVEPISWRLFTTEPVDTPEQVEAVVDIYRARWTIEEYFKALKTGCAVEKRQLESYRSLANALAVFAVIAWRILLLRTVARVRPAAPAADALDEQQVRVLRGVAQLADPRLPKLEIPAAPTAHDVLRAVAQLGGHIANNGPPGWQVLARGFESLLLLQLGWRVRDEM
jgi:hypothetical protein